MDPLRFLAGCGFSYESAHFLLEDGSIRHSGAYVTLLKLILDFFGADAPPMEYVYEWSRVNGSKSWTKTMADDRIDVMWYPRFLSSEFLK